jgi:integrase
MKGLYFQGGKWYSRIQYQGQRYKKCWGPVTKQVAAVKHGRFRGKVWSGDYQRELEEKRRQAERVTLAQFKEEYLRYYKDQWREKSYKRVKVALKPLCEALGSRWLNDIKALDLARYKRDRKTQGVSVATINRELNTLSNVYRIAIRYDRCRENPLNGVKRYKEDNEAIWVLTDDEEDRLLDACGRTEERMPYLQNLVTVALYSGMRLGEIFDMRKEHVDFKNEVVIVPNSKTHTSRKIPKSAMDKSGGPWVFSNFKGEKIRYLKRGFWDAVAEAGLMRKIGDKAIRFRFHDLRHTFGSRLGANGTDLKSIMEIMGHVTPKVALRYQHPTHDHKKAAVLALDRKRETAPEMAPEKMGGRKIVSFQRDGE